MGCKNHSIEVKGFGESFLVNRRIVQLSGSVKSPCSCDSVEIRRTNDGSTWKVPLFNKSFKQLISLITNCENIFELRYCDVQLSIHLEHKSIEKVIHDVQPIYIITKNHDGRFQSTHDDVTNGIDAALVKIDLALELAQCIFSSKLNEGKFGERSFVLQKCRVFRSDLETKAARALNQWDLYDLIADELLLKEGIDIRNRRKFVGFLSCTKFEGLKADEEYSYVNIKAKTSASPALGGNFLCLMGSGCFFSWPNEIEEVVPAFKSKQKVDLTQVLDDSNYRRTYGGCFASSLGALVHEMGHIFDLAHTETGLMGNDIDYIHRFFLSENFTEILPKRNVRSCQVNNQDNKQRLNNHKFTKIKKPGGIFLEKYYEQKDNDMTFFEPNCLVTLWLHQWFTQNKPNDNDVTYNEADRIVQSKTCPIVLVEIRELSKNDSMLIKFFSLTDQNVREFVIPSDVKVRNVTLFVVNSQGGTLKTDLIH